MIEKLTETGNSKYPVMDENETYYTSKLMYLQLEYLGLCGCGNPEEVSLYIKTLLYRLKIQDWGSYEDLPYMFFIYWANDKGFADHETTARCSSLTELGEELLHDLEICLEEKRNDN